MNQGVQLGPALPVSPGDLLTPPLESLEPSLTSAKAGQSLGGEFLGQSIDRFSGNG
jgi:hypothetical protein